MNKSMKRFMMTVRASLALVGILVAFSFGYRQGAQDQGLLTQQGSSFRQSPFLSRSVAEEEEEEDPIRSRKLTEEEPPKKEQNPPVDGDNCKCDDSPTTNNSEKKPLVVVSSEERSFFEIGKGHDTDKVAAHHHLPICLKDSEQCIRKGCANERCRAWGHFYDSMYQSRLGKYSRNDTEPFQFLEIGFYNGNGFETYMDFFPRAEAHSMEISCLPHGSREEGKWPFENFAAVNKKWYQTLLDQNRLHCGDANDVKWIHQIWTEKMKRPDAPPLRVVVDDGAHVAEHMAQSVFFWFPRLQPGGLLVIEDIQPIHEANKFRKHFLPQIMADLHYCGDPKLPDQPCFPTIQPLLQSIHCEMHICIFERNDEPARELSLEESTMPPGAMNLTTCRSFQN